MLADLIVSVHLTVNMSSPRTSLKGKSAAINKPKTGGLKLRATTASTRKQSNHSRESSTSLNKRSRVMGSSDWRHTSSGCVTDNKENKTTERQSNILSRSGSAFEMAHHNLPAFDAVDHYYDDAKDRIIHVLDTRKINLVATPSRSGKGSKAIYLCVPSPTSDEKKHSPTTDDDVRSPLAQLRIPMHRGKQMKSVDDVGTQMGFGSMRPGDRVVVHPMLPTRNASTRYRVDVNRKVGEIATCDTATAEVISSDIDNLEEFVVVGKPHRRPCHVEESERYERFSMLMGRLASSGDHSRVLETNPAIVEAGIKSSDGPCKATAQLVPSDVRIDKAVAPKSASAASFENKTPVIVDPAIIEARARPQLADANSVMWKNTKPSELNTKQSVWTNRPSRADSGYESSSKMQLQLQDLLAKHRMEAARSENQAESSAIDPGENGLHKGSITSGVESPSKGRLNPLALSFFASEQDSKKQILQPVENAMAIPSPVQTTCELLKTAIELPEKTGQGRPAAERLQITEHTGQPFASPLLPFAQQLMPAPSMLPNNVATSLAMTSAFGALDMAGPLGPLPEPATLPNLFNTFPSTLR